MVNRFLWPVDDIQRTAWHELLTGGMRRGRSALLNLLAWSARIPGMGTGLMGWGGRRTGRLPQETAAAGVRGTFATTSHGGCGEIRLALGVYLLGAIGPTDRAAVDGYLPWCAACREELAGLAGLPALLSSVSVAHAVLLDGDDGQGAGAVMPPDTALLTLLDQAVRGRRRLRWRRVAAGTAASLLVAGIALTGSRALEPPATRQPAAALPWAGIVHGSHPASGAGATVRYQPRPWGLQLQVRVSGIRPGTRCQLQVVTADGQEAMGGGWAVTSARSWAWYPASSPFALAAVQRFLVTSAGKTLVSVLLQ